MNIDELIVLLRQKYPEISQQADNRYGKFFLDKEPYNTFPSFWLECFVYAVNPLMNELSNEKQVKTIFEVFRKSYLMGDDDLKQSIDVNVVENLFWQIKDDYREHYWHLFPTVLQDLYFNFFRQKPFCE